MTPLSARLQRLADRVLPGLPMADVGTDHAALPVALVLAGRVPLAIGIDRRPAPLRAARAGAAAALAKDPRLDLRQGEGLAPLSPGEVATVVIAGMGGERCLALLRAAPAVLARLQRLVLQPNTDWPAVRAGLVALGWRIIDEDLVHERGQTFLTLVCAPGAGPLDRDALTADELLLGPVLLRDHPPAFGDWLAQQCTRLERSLAAAQGSPAAPALALDLSRVQAALSARRPG